MTKPKKKPQQIKVLFVNQSENPLEEKSPVRKSVRKPIGRKSPVRKSARKTTTERKRKSPVRKSARKTTIERKSPVRKSVRKPQLKGKVPEVEVLLHISEKKTVKKRLGICRN